MGNDPQADCIIVQAMIPADTQSAGMAQATFATRSRDVFSELYYAEEDLDDDRLWDTRDLDSEDAPHVPVPLSYELRLAHFHDVVDVANLLADGPEYRVLMDRIAARFTEVTDE